MPKRILIVDDTATVVMFEKMMLSSQGYAFDTATNGEDALVLVEQRRPDLILLDIMMPKMDGIETCRRLKSNPDTNAIPVVMVTTKGEAERVEQAFLAGCDDYITKPVDKLELLTKVATHLSRTE